MRGFFVTVVGAQVQVQILLHFVACVEIAKEHLAGKAVEKAYPIIGIADIDRITQVGAKTGGAQGIPALFVVKPFGAEVEVLGGFVTHLSHELQKVGTVRMRQRHVVMRVVRHGIAGIHEGPHHIDFPLQKKVFYSEGIRNFGAQLKGVFIRPPTVAGFDFGKLKFVQHHLSVQHRANAGIDFHIQSQQGIVRTPVHLLDAAVQDDGVHVLKVEMILSSENDAFKQTNI